MSFQNGVRRVAYEVDKHLLQLIRIGLECDIGSRLDADLQASFEPSRTRDQRCKSDGAKGWSGHLRKPAIRFEKAVQGRRAGFDDFQAALEIGANFWIHRGRRDTGTEATCD